MNQNIHHSLRVTKHRQAWHGKHKNVHLHADSYNSEGNHILQ